MASNDIRMIYKKEQGLFVIPEIILENYKDDYLQMELDLESALFYEFRKKNGWLPHRINESSEKEINEIKEFFNSVKNSFLFLFINKEFIGSILFNRNYIQCLSIAKIFQRQGYGTLLTKYAANRILEMNYQCVELNVFPDNITAINMYKSWDLKLSRRNCESCGVPSGDCGYRIPYRPSLD